MSSAQQMTNGTLRIAALHKLYIIPVIILNISNPVRVKLRPCYHLGIIPHEGTHDMRIYTWIAVNVFALMTFEGSLCC